MMKAFPILVLSVVMAGPAWASENAAAQNLEIDAVEYMSPEGHKVSPPDPLHPVYYVPAVVGYQEREMGEDVLPPDENAPLRDEVFSLVSTVLGQQGYLVAKPAPHVNASGQVTYADGTVLRVPSEPGRKRPIALNGTGDEPLTVSMISAPDGPYSASRLQTAAPGQPRPPLADVLAAVDPRHGPVLQGTPSLLLTIHWGHISPQFERLRGRRIFVNEEEMAALVGANGLDLATGTDQQALRRVEAARYFVIISAFDFQAYTATHKKVLLWQAKMSVPSSRGMVFNDILSDLVAAGGPLMGRETAGPQIQHLSKVLEGRVIVGTPEEVGGKSAPPSEK